MTIAASPELLAVAVAPALARQLVVEVEFESHRERRSAVGGGRTLADALAFARESLPRGRWRVVRVRDLFGD